MPPTITAPVTTIAATTSNHFAAGDRPFDIGTLPPLSRSWLFHSGRVDLFQVPQGQAAPVELNPCPTRNGRIALPDRGALPEIFLSLGHVADLDRQQAPESGQFHRLPH